MITLGVILIILGWILGIWLLYTIGAILLIIGVVLLVMGTIVHRPVGGRAHYF